MSIDGNPYRRPTIDVCVRAESAKNTNIFRCSNNLGTPENPLYATRADPLKLTNIVEPKFTIVGGDMAAEALPEGAVLVARRCNDELMFFVAQRNGALHCVNEGDERVRAIYQWIKDHLWN